MAASGLLALAERRDERLGVRFVEESSVKLFADDPSLDDPSLDDPSLDGTSIEDTAAFVDDINACGDGEFFFGDDICGKFWTGCLAMYSVDTVNGALDFVEFTCPFASMILSEGFEMRLLRSLAGGIRAATSMAANGSSEAGTYVDSDIKSAVEETDDAVVEIVDSIKEEDVKITLLSHANRETQNGVEETIGVVVETRDETVVSVAVEILVEPAFKSIDSDFLRDGLDMRLLRSITNGSVETVLADTATVEIVEIATEELIVETTLEISIE